MRDRRDHTPLGGIRLSMPREDPPDAMEMQGQLLAGLSRLESRIGAMETTDAERPRKLLAAIAGAVLALCVPVAGLVWYQGSTTGVVLERLDRMSSDIAEVHSAVQGHTTAIGDLRTTTSVGAGRIDDLRDELKVMRARVPRENSE